MTDPTGGDPPIDLHVPGFPAFDADALFTAAATWTNVANSLRCTVDAIQLRVSGVGGTWTGSAREAFTAEWAALAVAIQELATELDKVATDLIHTAEELEAHKREYDHIMLELGISALVSVGVSLFTFGGGALVTGANAVRLIARAENIIRLVLAMAARFVLAAAGGSLREIATRFAVNAGLDVATTMGGNVVKDWHSNPFREISPKDVTIASAAGVFMPFHGENHVLIRGAADGVTLEALIQLFHDHELDPGHLALAGVTGAAGAKILGFFEGRRTQPAAGGGGVPPAAAAEQPRHTPTGKARIRDQIRETETREATRFGKGDPQFDPSRHKSPLGADFRPGVVDERSPFKANERPIADYLAARGEMVHARRVDKTDFMTNPDAMIRSGPDDPGAITDFKTIAGPNNANSVKNFIRKAQVQVDQKGGGAVVIDGRHKDLTLEQAMRGYADARLAGQLGGRGIPDRIRVILGDGTIRELPVTG